MKKVRFPITIDLSTQELEDKKNYLIKKGFNISTLVRNFINEMYEKESRALTSSNNL